MKLLGDAGDLYSRFIQFIEKFIATRFWKVKLVLLLTFLSMVFSTGQLMKLHGPNINWKTFEEKKENLFVQPKLSPDLHAAKTTFRLTVPLVAKILHFNKYEVFLLNILTSILFLYFSILLAEKITGDSVTAFFAAVGMAFIYTGHAGLIDVYTWFDSYAYLFMILAMLSSNAFLIALLIQLSSWTDERAFIAGGFVFLWWKFQETKSTGFNLSSFFKPGLKSSLVVVSLIIYLAARFFLEKYVGMITPHEGTGFKVLFTSTNYYGMGLWTAFEGFWLLVVAAFIYLLNGRKLFASFSLVIMMGIITVVSFLVYDITRSMAYMFPVIFISMDILSEKFSELNMRKLLMICAFFCVAFPSYFIITTVDPHIMWYKPIFIRVIDFILKNQEYTM